MNRDRTPSQTVLLAALLLVAGGCGRRAAERERPKSEAAPSGTVTFTAAQVQHGGVRWIPVETSDVAPTVEAPGQLVPNEDRTTRVGAPAQARVMAVHVRVGQRVAAGASLVTLQSQQASAARADVQKAEAEVASRRSALVYARGARERAQRLLAAKAASLQEVERTRADEALAQSTMAQAEAELARARTVIGHFGKVDPSGEVAVRSTFSGVVLTRDAKPGAVVEPGSPLVSITDDTTLWLEVALADRAASALRVGQSVTFTVPAYPGETFRARVETVGGALDEKTRTLPLRALVANRERKLRPQMFATVLVETGVPAPVVAVAESAVVLVDEKPVLFVARPDPAGGAVFQRRDVEIAGKRDGKVFIRRGVGPGEVVVVEGAFAIKSQLERSKMTEG